MSGCLHRAGLRAETVWPYPEVLAPPPSLCVVFADADRLDRAIDLLHGHQGVSVLMLDAERLADVGPLVAGGCHGVLFRPIRSTGLIVQLCIAVTLHARIARAEDRLRHVEDNLRNRRIIEQVVRTFVAAENVSHEEAFEALRTQAMQRRITVVDLAREMLDQANGSSATR
jgi:AmiR/NasT family two-component response regulator